jgi:hypothetical protein
MTQYETGFDLLNKNLEKALTANANNQKARMDLQNSLLIAKVKSLQEQDQKKNEMGTKFQYDLALKGAQTPYQKMMMETYQKQVAGGDSPSNFKIRPGASGFTVDKTNIRDTILGKIQKGEQLLPGELQIYNETMKRGNNAPLFATDKPGEAPTGQPSAQPVAQPIDTIRVKHIGSGQTGTINSTEFDPAVYEKI